VIAWRLATTLHPPLTGEGARKRGGRWNSIGVPLVYASEHLSLAVLELLVHVESDDLPDTLAAYELTIPAEQMEQLDDVPTDWFADPFQRQTRRFGDSWAAEQRSLTLTVPSALIRRENNVLLNPLHPGFAEIRIRNRQAFQLDPRLRTRAAPY
jgi:RES domain-containing protein